MKSTRHVKLAAAAGRIVLLITAVSIVSGCSSSTQSLERSLLSEKGCCDSYKQFRFEPVAIDKESEFEIGAAGKAHAFSFPEGKSYFKAVELPRRTEQYELLVVTKIHARGLSYSTSHVFYPKLVFLDDALAVVDTLEPQLGYRVGLFGSHYKGKVLLKPGYRYLVLYTDPTRLREKVFIRGSHFETATVNGVTVSGVKGAEYTNRGAAGTVEIGFERKVQAK